MGYKNKKQKLRIKKQNLKLKKQIEQLKKLQEEEIKNLAHEMYNKQPHYISAYEMYNQESIPRTGILRGMFNK